MLSTKKIAGAQNVPDDQKWRLSEMNEESVVIAAIVSLLFFQVPQKQDWPR